MKKVDKMTKLKKEMGKFKESENCEKERKRKDVWKQAHEKN